MAGAEAADGAADGGGGGGRDRADAGDFDDDDASREMADGAGGAGMESGSESGLGGGGIKLKHAQFVHLGSDAWAAMRSSVAAQVRMGTWLRTQRNC